MSFVEIYGSIPFLCFILLQYVCFFALNYVFQRTKHFCHNPTGAAQQFVALGCFSFLGGYAFYIWFLDPNFAPAFEDDILFSFYEPCQMLIHVMIGFMVFDTGCLIIARSSPEFFVHHILVMLLANIGLMYGGPDGPYFALYFGVFFFGISELSSIPLAFVDMFRSNRQLANAYPEANGRIRIAFAVMFFVIRIFYWPYVMFIFCTSLFSRLDEVAFFAWFSFAGTAILLTLLQWFWGILIIRGAVRMARSQPDPVEEKINEKRGSFTSLVG